MDGEWQTIKIPFDEFVPAFRAKTVKDGAKLDPSCVMSIQLMLSKFELDGELNPNFELGEFSLPITSIKGYMNSKPVSGASYVQRFCCVEDWNSFSTVVQKLTNVVS